MTPPSGPHDDPVTVVGLIYRVLNEPRRSLCAISILALPTGALAQLGGAQPLLGVPMGWIGLFGSTGGLLLTWIASRRRGPPAASSGNDSGNDGMSSPIA